MQVYDKFYIGGKWVAPKGKDKLEVIDPSTEEVCGVVPSGNAEDVNAAVKAAAEGPMQGVLQYSEEPLVSTDIIGSPYSSIFDSKLTGKIGEKMFKLISWYDNEYGYSTRCVDLFKRLAAEG